MLGNPASVVECGSVVQVVVAIDVDGRTTVMAMTFSLIVPYFTAAVPEAAQAHIPPIVASAPGSTMNCILS